MIRGEVGVKSEKLGWLVQHAFFFFIEWHHVIHAFDVFPEVSFVQFFVEHDLVKGLKLS